MYYLQNVLLPQLVMKEDYGLNVVDTTTLDEFVHCLLIKRDAEKGAEKGTKHEHGNETENVHHLPYVDSINAGDMDHVGLANVMLSYSSTCDCTILDLITSLATQCQVEDRNPIKH